VRLNARQHASRQGWATIIEQFEGQLRGACERELVASNASTVP